ncbi:MAG: IS66 family transposase [Methylococcales bacterium]|nr:IS66 family transposase [Methylococcales bacterium]
MQEQNSTFELCLKNKDTIIEQLKEALILARNARFASSSEAMRGMQVDMFDEAEQSADEELDLEEDANEDELVTVDTHQRRRGGRKSLPADLPRVDIIHDLTEADKVCPHDGHALKEIGSQVSEQLDIIPMKIQVLRHICKQYACPCCEGYLKAARKPKQPIEKSQASAGLLAYIATSKYADSLPLYRQSGILKRFGIELDRTTLSNWMIRCGTLVQPLINRIEEQLLISSYLHMDETTVQVLKEAGKTAQSKSYMWVRSAGPPGARMILFDYDPSRKACVPSRLLAGYEGALMVDGYSGYDAVCRQQALTRLGCWAHARRKFVEAAKAQAGKKKPTKAAYAIKLIAKLYSIEKQIEQKRRDYASGNDFTLYRYEQRQQRAKPLIEKLRIWLNDTRPKVAPKLKLGEALRTVPQIQDRYLRSYFH